MTINSQNLLMAEIKSVVPHTGGSKLRTIPLVGTYLDDLDLQALHNSVLLHFVTKHDNALADLRYRVGTLEQKIKVNPSPGAETTLAKLQLELAFTQREAMSDVKRYVEATKNILAQYTSLTPASSTIIFSRKTTKTSSDNDDLRTKRLTIINNYLKTARKYAPVSYIYTEPDYVACLICQTELEIGSDRCPNTECQYMLPTEVRVTPVSVTTKKRAMQANTMRILAKIQLPEELKIDTSIIRGILTSINLNVIDKTLPGKYILFKLAQLQNRKIVPADCGMKKTNQNTLTGYDRYWSIIVKQNSTELKQNIPSF